jgi:hypothetical protein
MYNPSAPALIARTICRTVAFKLLDLLFSLRTLYTKQAKAMENMERGRVTLARIGRRIFCVVWKFLPSTL